MSDCHSKRMNSAAVLVQDKLIRGVSSNSYWTWSLCALTQLLCMQTLTQPGHNLLLPSNAVTGLT